MEVDSRGTRSGGADVAARIVDALGRGISWLTLFMTVLIFAVVVLRYGLNLGWIWLQESVTYLHAMIFMIAVAWAFQSDDHVRVDIFYRDRPTRHKHLVNLAGTVLFVIPFSVFLLYIGWDYVAASWTNHEASREAGGLPAVWLLKSLILVLPALLLLQSWSTLRLCLSGLRGPAANEAT